MSVSTTSPLVGGPVLLSLNNSQLWREPVFYAKSVHGVLKLRAAMFDPFTRSRS